MKSRLFYFLFSVLFGLGCMLLMAGEPDELTGDVLKLDREHIAVYLDGETLHVHVMVTPEGKVSGKTLSVQLVPSDGEARAKSADISDIPGPQIKSFAFSEIKIKKEDVATYTLKCVLDGRTLEGPLGEWLFKTHDTYILGQDEFASGSSAALRIAVRGARSLAESAPFPGAEVSVTLKGEGLEEKILFTGRTGPHGTLATAFQIPDLKEGEYALVVKTKSPLGTDEIEKKIKIKSSTKILLVMDKPLYQPGQEIQIRALALGRVSLKPAAESELLFEILDPKGNKVFKKKRTTNAFGIASARFRLADEVNMGRYRIQATIGKEKAEKTAEVKKYVLPKFKVRLETTKKFFLPKETVKGFIQADYFFGKPVAGAKVTIKASTFDVRFRQFAALKDIKTDDTGKAEFELKLPDYFVGTPLEKGNALLKLDVELKDTADHTEKTTKTFPVAAAPIQVGAIPECGRLVPGIENIIYCVATYPDGSPAANASITLKGVKVGEMYFLDETARTNAGGIATVKITPKKEWFRYGNYDYSKRDRYGRPTQNIIIDAVVSVVDDKGCKAQRKLVLSSKPFGEDIILRLDKAVYAAGDTLSADVLTTAVKGLVYLDITRGRQTVLTKTVEIANGKGHLDFNVTADIFGSLEVHAYRVTPSGQMMRDTRVIYVHPARNLGIKIDLPKTTFLPGEENVAIDFFVTGKDGQPTQSALGIIIVDESVYALQDMQPGLEKIYFTLEAELAKPQVEICNHPFKAEQFVRERELKEAKQDAAKVMFASAEPVTEFSWNRNPATIRAAKYGQNLYAVYSALYRHVNELGEFAVKDENSGKWGFRKDLLKMFIEKKYIKEEQIRDPLDEKAFITMKSLSGFSAAFSFKRWLAADTSFKKHVLWQVIWNRVATVDVVEGKTGAYKFKKGALENIAKAGGCKKKQFITADGKEITLEKLAIADKAFRPANIALATESRRKQAIWNALWSRMGKSGLKGIITFDEEKKVWVFAEGAPEKLGLNKITFKTPDGTDYNLDALAKSDKAFAAVNLMSGFLNNRVKTIYNRGVCSYLHHGAGRKYKIGGKWDLPDDIVDEFVRQGKIKKEQTLDPWGNQMKLVARQRRGGGSQGCGISQEFMVISAGPDGKFDTADDWKESDSRTGYTQYRQETGLVTYQPTDWHAMGSTRRANLGSSRFFGTEVMERPVIKLDKDIPRGVGWGRGQQAGDQGKANGKARLGWMPEPKAPPMERMKKKESGAILDLPDEEKYYGKGGPRAGVVPKPVRIREYFPETLLFEPSLITDEGGRARLVIPQLADSITTFRMTASAIAKSGALGGATGSIRIFQDFFVDIDLPVMLTRGDEVSIPVAVYNYLQTDQDVRITMEKDVWFELLSGQSQTLSLKPGEVTATYFRIRAKKVGFQKLLVKAEGSKMSDAMRRVIEVAPDGKKFEFVDNGRLTGEVEAQINIPPDSIPDSYKILVKIYPGIYSQVTEGMEAMLCLPGG
ncbi:MAG: hypothetical protein E3J72_22725 [Planctomycetota bacterium]|nr:MAG: hypothetical protein E3J72_22725 [Planctomycetota bacterium]